MMEENGSKKVLLSVLGVAILVVAVVGISFAAFTFTNSSGENTISTGTITMSYSEEDAGILIDDALPLSDDKGIALKEDNEVFEFTVSTKASGTLSIPYEINVTNATSAGTDQVALTDSQVKVYLTKNGSQVLAPATVTSLANSTLRTGSKVLYTTTDSHTSTTPTATSTYQLKMWVASNVDISAADWDSTKTHVYKLLVNVDSHVNPVGQQ